MSWYRPIPRYIPRAGGLLEPRFPRQPKDTARWTSHSTVLRAMRVSHSGRRGGPALIAGLRVAPVAWATVSRWAPGGGLRSWHGLFGEMPLDSCPPGQGIAREG